MSKKEFKETNTVSAKDIDSTLSGITAGKLVEVSLVRLGLISAEEGIKIEANTQFTLKGIDYEAKLVVVSKKLKSKKNYE